MVRNFFQVESVVVIT